MGQVHQLDIEGGSEVGVCAKHINGELHLVDDSLAGTVAAAEKFEVLDSVVVSDSVDVMDSFFGQKFPSDVFFHNKSVLENASFFPIDQNGNCDNGVALTGRKTSRVPRGVFVKRPRFLPLGLTHLVAKFLGSVVNGSACNFVSGHCIHFATLLASKYVSFYGVRFPAYGTARQRAIERVAPMLLSDSSNNAALHGKCGPALFAGEVVKRDVSGGSAVFSFMRRHTCLAAKTLRRITGLHLEVLGTLFANLLNGHIGLSVSRNRHSTPVLFMCKGAI